MKITSDTKRTKGKTTRLYRRTAKRDRLSKQSDGLLCKWETSCGFKKTLFSLPT